MFLSCLKPACVASVSAGASCEFVVVGQALLSASSTYSRGNASYVGSFMNKGNIRLVRDLLKRDVPDY